VRILKWVAIGLGSLLALVLIGVLVVVWLVDPNRFKPRIERAVKDATGRELTLTGDIELGFFPWLALRTGEGSFGNAPGFGPSVDQEPMVRWKSAQLGAKLFPLLGGELVADRVRLSGVDLQLIRHADGKANWEGIGSQEPASPSTGETQFRIDGVEIDDSRVLFVDETVPRRVEVTGFHFETDEIDFGHPFTDTTIAGTLHMDGFAPAGVPFEIELPRVDLPKDFSSIAVQEYTVKFGGLEVQGGVEGKLGDALNVGGLVETNEFDPRALLRAVGIEPPKTTDPKALGVVALKGQWQVGADGMSLGSLTLRLDDSHFTGALKRGAGDDPVSDIRLDGDTLDLARYVPPPDPHSEPFTLPTATLKALKFRGTVQLGEAKYADTLLKGVTIRLLLDEQGLRNVEAPK